VPDDYATDDGLRARIAIHAYGTNPVPWYDFVRARLPLAPGERVLDAGAGTGALWEYEHRARLVLLDFSEAMRHDVRGDAGRLPFRDAAFDGAVCHHVLYHLARPADGLAELRRVVRPGGWVTVATNGTGHMAGLGEDVHTAFPAERLGDAMAEHFDDVVLHPYEDELVVPDEPPYRFAKHTVLATARRPAAP
jgi:SAM-dependent methyltransferase